jgi:hypothetical protein
MPQTGRRSDCRRAVHELAPTAETEALRILADLKREFAEAPSGSPELRLESLYTQTHLLHREIANYCWAGGYEFGMGVVTRLPGC